MNLKYLKSCILPVLIILIFSNALIAQQADSSNEFKPKGTIWANAFFDYNYKDKMDSITLARGGSNQYSKIPVYASFLQIRRIYFGYNYDIFPKLSAEFLLAMEDDFNQGSVGNQTSPGDVLGDGKLAPYLKIANIRWKNIFRGSDLVLGETLTPSYARMSELIWGYRSIERTITDIRRTPSFDQGIALEGHFDRDANYGYNIMVGNGNGAKPITNNFKWYYGDIWAKFLDKKVIVDLYQDYYIMDWNTEKLGMTNMFHHDRNMTKLFVAYTVPKFTVGVEVFANTLMNDVQVNTKDSTFYRTTFATGISFFARGRVYKNILGFFARYDNYDPSHNIKELTTNPKFLSYNALTNQYDPTTKEQFVTLGLDYTPFPNLHLMPNIWYDVYNCALRQNFYKLNPKGSGYVGVDEVFRITVYYIFGKKDSVRY